MELPPLEPASPRYGLSDTIHDALREAIIRGDLPAGYRLREIALSKHFGVSTTPVRSALQRLDFEGLVEISPRRGAVVATVDGRQLRDLYDLRELLECHALQRAADTDGHDLADIKELLADCDVAAKSDDPTRFNELDLTFHARLTELGGNAELLEVAQQTHRRIQAVRMRYAVVLSDQPRVSHSEHVAIVEALESGNPESAIESLRKHITSVRDLVLEVVHESEKSAN